MILIVSVLNLNRHRVRNGHIQSIKGFRCDRFALSVANLMSSASEINFSYQIGQVGVINTHLDIQRIQLARIGNCLECGSAALNLISSHRPPVNECDNQEK